MAKVKCGQGIETPEGVPLSRRLEVRLHSDAKVAGGAQARRNMSRSSSISANVSYEGSAPARVSYRLPQRAIPRLRRDPNALCRC